MLDHTQTLCQLHLLIRLRPASRGCPLAFVKKPFVRGAPSSTPALARLSPILPGPGNNAPNFMLSRSRFELTGHAGSMVATCFRPSARSGQVGLHHLYQSGLASFINTYACKVFHGASLPKWLNVQEIGSLSSMSLKQGPGADQI